MSKARPDGTQHELLAEVLRTLANPVRLRILEGLCESECNVNRLWQRLGISQSLASQHLNRLRRAGLVACERRGQFICYRVADPQVTQWLRSFAKLVQQRKKT